MSRYWKIIGSLSAILLILVVVFVRTTSVQGQSGNLVQGGVPRGTSPDLQYPMEIGGYDGSTLQSLSVDSSGRINLAPASIGGSVDPCQSKVKSSAPINITSATTTSLVASSSGKVITVCGLSIAMIGTISADTFLLEYGTGATCTSPTALTGAISSGILTAGATFFEVAYSLGSSAATANLCAVTTVGVGPSIQGVVSYIQQ